MDGTPACASFKAPSMRGQYDSQKRGAAKPPQDVVSVVVQGLSFSRVDGDKEVVLAAVFAHDFDQSLPRKGAQGILEGLRSSSLQCIGQWRVLDFELFQKVLASS